MKHTFALFITTLCLLMLTACAVQTSVLPPPETPSPSSPVSTRTPTATELEPGEETPVFPTPSPSQAVRLPEHDRIIFTIPNQALFSGREGEPRPDWLGWGAETFAVAPDGSFWIADTAVDPDRLLQFDPRGELLQEIPLQDLVVFPYSIAASQDAIWILDLSSGQPKVVQLSMEGEFLSSAAIPREIMMQDGEFVSNSIFNLSFGERGELLLRGLSGYYELINASGEITARSLEAVTYYGHSYRIGIYDQATQSIPIFVDASPFEISPDFKIEPPFLGFNPDGSFALAGYTQDNANQTDYLVKYYSPSGELLGTARQRPQTFYKDWNHHLAFGPDGPVYQLLSNLDHSVQIVRLGFSIELPPKIDLPVPTPTPLTALKPSESATTDEEQALNVLLAFFTHLSEGRYVEAAASFGGEVDEYARDRMPGETIEAYWQYLCGYLWCLPVADITDVEQVTENEYIFYVVFMQPDGTRFEIGACCGGDPAATPPVWQFAYPVQKIEGVWKVMRGPLFTP